MSDKTSVKIRLTDEVVDVEMVSDEGHDIVDLFIELFEKQPEIMLLIDHAIEHVKADKLLKKVKQSIHEEALNDDDKVKN